MSIADRRMGSSALPGAIRDGVLFHVEADFGSGRSGRRGHELANSFKEGTDGGVVAFEAAFQFGGEVSVNDTVVS